MLFTVISLKGERVRPRVNSFDLPPDEVTLFNKG